MAEHQNQDPCSQTAAGKVGRERERETQSLSFNVCLVNKNNSESQVGDSEMPLVPSPYLGLTCPYPLSLSDAQLCASPLNSKSLSLSRDAEKAQDTINDYSRAADIQQMS